MSPTTSVSFPLNNVLIDEVSIRCNTDIQNDDISRICVYSHRLGFLGAAACAVYIWRAQGMDVQVSAAAVRAYRRERKHSVIKPNYTLKYSRYKPRRELQDRHEL